MQSYRSLYPTLNPSSFCLKRGFNCWLLLGCTPASGTNYLDLELATFAVVEVHDGICVGAVAVTWRDHGLLECIDGLPRRSGLLANRRRSKRIRAKKTLGCRVPVSRGTRYSLL